MGQICCTAQDFSRQKTWYIFDSKPNTIQKSRLFFLRTIFPPKDLVYSWLKTRDHSKAQTFLVLRTIIPPKDFSPFSRSLWKSKLFKPKQYCCQKAFFNFFLGHLKCTAFTPDNFLASHFIAICFALHHSWLTPLSFLTFFFESRGKN